MRRLTGCVQTIGLAVAVVGAVTFVWWYRPVGWGDLVQVVTFVVPRAVLHPVVLAAAAVAVVSGLVARLVAPARSFGVRRRTRHVVDARPAQPMVPPTDGVAPQVDVPFAPSRDTVAFLDQVLRDAIERDASDVHLTPRAEDSLLSLRIDGRIEPYATLDHDAHDRLLRRIKILADLVVYVTDRPQDGAFTLETPVVPVDVRTSVLPTKHGEKAVLRLASAAAGYRRLDALGLGIAQGAQLRALLTRPEGLIVLTGPTGSGKTTTLYAALDHIHRRRGETAAIASIEDPVEIDLPFLSQTQVDPTQGLGFAEGLRAVLRQDPNVLMVGEIRDAETAAIAVQAGLTGHLILSTLHADHAAGVFNRLIDMGVEPFRVASAVQAAIAQRLLRRLCPACRVPTVLGADAANRLGRRGLSTAGLRFYNAKGCDRCDDRGYVGRVALFEILEATPELVEHVSQGRPSQRIEETARAGGMVPLAQAALDAAADGDVSLADALRLIA